MRKILFPTLDRRVNVAISRQQDERDDRMANAVVVSVVVVVGAVYVSRLRQIEKKVFCGSQ